MAVNRLLHCGLSRCRLLEEVKGCSEVLINCVLVKSVVCYYENLESNWFLLLKSAGEFHDIRL